MTEYYWSYWKYSKQESDRQEFDLTRQLAEIHHLQALILTETSAVRSLLLMRSLTDATELYSSMEQHIRACCPNQVEL